MLCVPEYLIHTAKIINLWSSLVIIAERKHFKEIYDNIREYKNVLILGCGSCVTVCMAGGEREVEILASLIKLSDSGIEVTQATIERQCDAEFFEEVKNQILEADVVLSMACGVGVQLCAELFDGKHVLPAVNTQHFGVTDSPGVWKEYCLGCGDCILHLTAGVCPIARCSKSLLNGPCGGSRGGMCEVDPENIPCAWQLIYDRLESIGQLHILEKNMPAKDWSKAHYGGVRTTERKDVQL